MQMSYEGAPAVPLLRVIVPYCEYPFEDEIELVAIFVALADHHLPLPGTALENHVPRDRELHVPCHVPGERVDSAALEMRQKVLRQRFAIRVRPLRRRLVDQLVGCPFLLGVREENLGQMVV